MTIELWAAVRYGHRGSYYICPGTTCRSKSKAAKRASDINTGEEGARWAKAHPLLGVVRVAPQVMEIEDRDALTALAYRIYRERGL